MYMYDYLVKFSNVVVYALFRLIQLISMSSKIDCNLASELAFMATISSFSSIISSLFNRISRSRSLLVQTGTEISVFFTSIFFQHPFSRWA